MSTEAYMETARGLAAQCWCEPETSHLEMDSTLAEVVAQKVAHLLEERATLKDRISLMVVENNLRAEGNKAIFADTIDVLSDCVGWLQCDNPAEAKSKNRGMQLMTRLSKEQA